MPRPVLEPLACRLPLLPPPESGHEHLLHDGVNGFIVPKNDPAAIVRVLKLLADSPELRARIGAAARETAEENSWDRFAERFRNSLTRDILPALGLSRA